MKTSAGNHMPSIIGTSVLVGHKTKWNRGHQQANSPTYRHGSAPVGVLRRELTKDVSSSAHYAGSLVDTTREAEFNSIRRATRPGVGHAYSGLPVEICWSGLCQL